jgi:hypothetical protein
MARTTLRMEGWADCGGETEVRAIEFDFFSLKTLFSRGSAELGFA